MKIIRKNTVSSTNSFLKQLVQQGVVQDYTVVTACYQTEGRGQMGNRWVSEDGKNLLFSVYKIFPLLPISRQFYINIAASLVVYEILDNYRIPSIAIKWPNDVMSNGCKLCGILAENTIRNGNVATSIIGIGINVHQENFPGLVQATSLKQLTGRDFHTGELLHAVLEILRYRMEELAEGKYASLAQAYEARLYGKGKPLRCKTGETTYFEGILTGITVEGKLRVCNETGIEKIFAPKEAEILYV